VRRFFDRNRKFHLDCPNGHQVPFTLKQAGKSSTARCPTCDAEIEIEVEDVQALQALQRIFEGERSMKNLGRRLSRRLRA
jgi:transcription elongation factor Elf1